MATIANETEWNSTFSEGVAPAAGVYTITSSFTFTAAPNKPKLDAGVSLQGSGYIITIDDLITGYVGLVDLNGGTIENLQVQLGGFGIFLNGGGIATGFGSNTSRLGGTIQNCFVRAKNSGLLSFTGICGGVVGPNYEATGGLTIYRVYVAGSCSFPSTGGIFGPNLKGTAPVTIDTCYVRGSPGSLPFFVPSGGPSSGSAVFVAVGSSGLVAIVNSYGIGAEDAIDIPSAGAQTQVAGFYGGILTGSSHVITNSFMSGVFLANASYKNGALQYNDLAAFQGTLVLTGVLYNTSGSANGIDTTQPANTAELSGYTSAGTSLPLLWGNMWVRNNSYPYLGGTLGFADNPWNPADYTGPGDLESLALLIEGACVVRGTLIRTPSGEIAIEELKQGDEVITGDGRITKIKSINHWSLVSKSERHLPRRVPANYFGKGLPHTDLFIHQDHAIKVNNKWVHVNHYVPEFERMTEMRGCEYFHIQLEDYMEDTYIANGLIVEPWDGRTPVEFTQPNVKFSWTCDVYEKRCLNNCERKKISA